MDMAEANYINPTINPTDQQLNDIDDIIAPFLDGMNYTLAKIFHSK